MRQKLAILSAIGATLVVALSPALHTFQVIAGVYHH